MPELTSLHDISKYLENKELKIFFSGIGGISMSAIAAALKQKGYKICGSDIKESDAVENLRNIGIKVFIGHKKENVDDDCGLLVYNARIKDFNPEIVRAKELNIPVIKRAQMLGFLMSVYKTSVGISGTHGKSTVTSMTSEIFMQAEKDPTLFIGTVYPPIKSAHRIGKEDYCIVESCEYANSFLDFYPNIAVILNIEMDHPDYFKDINHIISSFEKFLENTSEAAIINKDDNNALKAAAKFKGEIITYSLKDPSANIFVKNIDYKNITPEFDIIADGKNYAHIKLSIPGEFNIYNAAAAASVAYKCGIDGKSVEAGLNIFKGAGRRFEYKGSLNGAKVYDDYAHHPTEVRKTLIETQKIANSNGGKLWYIFQPHTYSRTHDLFEDFCEALSHADNLILTEIYSATEQNNCNISSKDMAARLKNCVLIENFGDIAELLKKSVGENDLVIITGAGDINNLTKLIV